MNELRIARIGLGQLLVLLVLPACRTSAPPPSTSHTYADAIRHGQADPGVAGARAGYAVVVGGKRYPTEAPVVLWDEEPFYDAHATGPRFSAEGPSGLRYQPQRTLADRALARGAGVGWELANLAEVVDLFVLHYDTCGTSRECFRVLHDQRGLSVHFLLDLDGTVYQTLDLGAQAWHARQANPRSIGIEMAQVGAYPLEKALVLERWYGSDSLGERILIPSRLGDGGVRTAGFRAAPSHAGRRRGTVHGRELLQYDFTPEQYDSLVALTATLVQLFPRIEPDAPRDTRGRVRSNVLTSEEFDAYHGILGHLHVSETKVDPGPAFDWGTYLRRVQLRLIGQRP